MKIRLRPSADADLLACLVQLAQNAGVAAAERFEGEAFAALERASRMPGIGSRLMGERSGIPELRAVRVHGYAYHWYYLVSGDVLDVLRLLPDMRDLAGILAQEAYDDDEQRGKPDMGLA